MTLRRRQLGFWSALVLALILAAFLEAQVPIKEYAGDIQHWILVSGRWGIAVFILCYVLLALIAPTTPLTVLAGFAFGFFTGLVIVLFSAAASAGLAFLLTRYLLRGRVAAFLARRPGFAVLDRVLAARGWQIVVLSQLNPFIPSNLQNFFYGLSDIPLRVFIPATALGLLPGIAFYNYVGALGTLVVQGTRGQVWWLLAALGLFATALILILLGRGAHFRLMEISDKQHP